MGCAFFEEHCSSINAQSPFMHRLIYDAVCYSKQLHPLVTLPPADSDSTRAWYSMLSLCILWSADPTQYKPPCSELTCMQVPIVHPVSDMCLLRDIVDLQLPSQSHQHQTLQGSADDPKLQLLPDFPAPDRCYAVHSHGEALSSLSVWHPDAWFCMCK